MGNKCTKEQMNELMAYIRRNRRSGHQGPLRPSRLPSWPHRPAPGPSALRAGGPLCWQQGTGHPPPPSILHLLNRLSPRRPAPRKAPHPVLLLETLFSRLLGTPNLLAFLCLLTSRLYIWPLFSPLFPSVDRHPPPPTPLSPSAFLAHSVQNLPDHHILPKPRFITPSWILRWV